MNIALGQGTAADSNGAFVTDTIVATAPAGTTAPDGRFLVRGEAFSGNISHPTGTASVFVDNISVIPEPSAGVLIGAAALGLVLLGRRR